MIPVSALLALLSLQVPGNMPTAIVSGGAKAACQNVVTGSRAMGTVYHNTGTVPIWVSATAQYPGSGGIEYYNASDSSSTPVANTADIQIGGPFFQAINQLIFPVVPNNYYYVNNVGSFTLTNWIEWSCNTTMPTAQTVVTGSRAYGTPYQNTTGSLMYVAITNLSDNNPAIAYTDSSTPPTTVVGQSTAPTGLSIGLNFLVLPGNWYEVTASAGTLQNWVEWINSTASPVSTQTDVTASRTLNTVYHNTSGKTIVVASKSHCNSGTTSGAISAITDSSSSPSTTVLQETVEGLSQQMIVKTMVFLVLSGNYYEVTMSCTVGTFGLNSWYEWQ